MSNIEDFVIANGVLKKYIGTGGDIVIPDCVTIISEKAFWFCSSLTSINIPEDVTTIGDCAFWGCENLKSINIPKNVNELDWTTFYGCCNLKEIHIDSSSTTFTEIDNIIYDQNLTTLCFCPNGREEHFTIPDSVTKIGDYAFSDCRKLSAITIPNGITEISKNAFSECSNLSNIEIPTSVKLIAEKAFSRCPLHKISIKGKPKLGIEAFACEDHDIKKYLTCEIEAPDKMEILPYMISWEDLRLSDLHSLLSAPQLRPADLRYIAKRLLASQKKLLPNFMKNITVSELLALENSGAITAAKSNLILDLLENNAECRAVYLDYYNSHFNISTQLQAEEEKIDRAVQRVMMQSKELQSAVDELNAMDTASLKKLWKTTEQGQGLTITKYGGDSAYIAIPGMIGNDSVYQIGKEAMRSAAPESGRKTVYNKKMYKIRGIWVSDGITEICSCAFFGSCLLKDIYLPASIQIIAEDAFQDCHKLTIHAPSGSYAESYAKEHNIPFAAE